MTRQLSIAAQAAATRRVYAMKIALAIALFFALALCVLQWSLMTGEQFAEHGVARNFVLIEAGVCAAAAVAAMLHLLFNAVIWAASRLARRSTTRRIAARLHSAA